LQTPAYTLNTLDDGRQDRLQLVVQLPGETHSWLASLHGMSFKITQSSQSLVKSLAAVSSSHHANAGVLSASELEVRLREDLISVRVPGRYDLVICLQDFNASDLLCTSIFLFRVLAIDIFVHPGAGAPIELPH
jgi:hypothetical protein